MDGVTELVNTLAEGAVGEALTTVTVGAGVIWAIVRCFKQIIDAQSIGDVEKAFMDKRRRSDLKYLELSAVIIAFFMGDLALVVTRDVAISVIMIVLAWGAMFFVVIYSFCKAYYLFCEVLKKDKVWKYETKAVQALFVCVIIIELASAILVCINIDSIWERMLVCLIIALPTAILIMMPGWDRWESSTRVYYKDSNGDKTYVYFRIDEDTLLCGNKKNMKEADVTLVSFEKFREEGHTLKIDKKESSTCRKTKKIIMRTKDEKQ